MVKLSEEERARREVERKQLYNLKMGKWSTTIQVVGVMLAGIVLLIQSVKWLRHGSWPAWTIETTFGVHLPQEPEWVGLARIIQWFLDWPAFIGVGLLASFAVSAMIGAAVSLRVWWDQQ